tara:strand:- start:102 stop:488 length:387 start_codon:yes stop_codon:yes gene_type:complete
MKQRYVIYGNDFNIISSQGYVRSYTDTDIDTPEKIKSIIDKFWNSSVLLRGGEYEFVSAAGKDEAIICFARGRNVLKAYGIMLPETHPAFNNLLTLLRHSRPKDVYNALEIDQRLTNYKNVVQHSIYP